MEIFDVAVVGRGMIGAAAARHLAESGHRTALIGPDEPPVRSMSHGPFSSHPDEGRVTRIAGRTPLWSQLAVRSIERYRDIERRSGIGFYSPNGLAVVVEELDEWITAGRAHGSDIRAVEAETLAATTGIAVSNGLPIGVEGPPAGHINPRRLVAAQTALVSRAGGSVIRETVDTVTRGSGRVTVGGPWGSVVARRVVLATGAFGRGLLEYALDLERRGRTVLLAEMADPGNLPSLILTAPPDPRLNEIYWVPPVPYPDGRTCLKIGGDLAGDGSIADADELVAWFQADGSAAEADALLVSLRELLPGADIRSTTHTPCVTTVTPSGHPYIGAIDAQVVVAIGGNGAAAKSSDELGRLAATVCTEDGWDTAYDPAVFAPQFV